ncbi:MAG: VOC family protein [Anaerolineae bacterium]
MANNPLVWVEIPVMEMDRAARFYEALFGVKLEISKDEVRQTATIFNSEGTGVGLSLTQNDTFPPSASGPLPYFMVDDLEASLKKVEEAGGRVIMARSEMSPDNYYATFADTEGNTLAFYYYQAPQQ